MALSVGALAVLIMIVLHRQLKGGGDLLLASLQPRVESLLQRSGFLEELGKEKAFGPPTGQYYRWESRFPKPRWKSKARKQPWTSP
ncbi:MAG: hypothetical protein ACRD1R_06325 [Acidobacteriota bacterium]